MSAVLAPAPSLDDERAVATWELHFRDPSAALERARAVHENPQLHGPRTRAWAELTEGFHRLCYTAGPLEARPWLDRAGQHFVALGDRRGALLVDTARARMLLQAREPLPAREMLNALLPDARSLLPATDLFWTLNTLAATYYHTEQIDEAIRVLYEALERLRGEALSPQLVTVLSNLSAALCTVGHYVPARELAQEALDLLAHFNNARLVLFARANLAEALVGIGDLGAALAVVDAMLADAATVRATTQNHFCAIAAEVYARHGRHADAQRCAALAAELDRHHPAPYGEVHTRWADACVAMAGTDADLGVEALAAAAEVATARRHLPVTCKSLAALAQRHAEARRFEAAWRTQCRLGEANEQRLLNRANTRYYLLCVERELAQLRDERDRELALRREADALNHQLVEVNAELSRKMREVEELQARLAREAVHDPLTGLFNRRYLDAALPGLASAADRQAAPLTIALIDLDHFKLVNDRHGHLAGDKVLRRIGRVLGGALRPSDIVARWGGEEFCIVFPGTDAAGAATALAALAEKLRALEVEWAGKTIGGFTFSAALASYGEHGRTLADMVGAADDALYAAKGAGRDRVLAAKPRQPAD